MQQPLGADDSDPEDEDYKPTAESDEEAVVGVENEKGAKKKRSSEKDGARRRRKGGIKLSDEENDDDESEGEARKRHKEDEQAEQEAAKVEKSKQEIEKEVTDIFEQMKRDAAAPPTPASATNGSNAEAKKEEFITVKETVQFAGEEITVEKKVAASSVQVTKEKPAPPSRLPAMLQKAAAKPKPKGDLNQLLANLGGAKKISSMEKSSLDWQKFKEKEGLEDELRQHQKSGGYLEKQAFLLRADYRQFEIERDARNKARKPPPTGGAGV